MVWISTNIRFPEDQYMELKIEAAKKRKSIAALIREKLEKRPPSRKRADYLLKEMTRLGQQVVKEAKGTNFTETLIRMRYER